MRSYLARFAFRGDEVFASISGLSGGEKGRLTLAVVMRQRHNLLLLDEPTNHLDLDSREALEESLEDFPGSIVFVSHDRAFIDRLATRVVDLRGGRAVAFRRQLFRDGRAAGPPPRASGAPLRPRSRGGGPGEGRFGAAASRSAGGILRAERGRPTPAKDRGARREDRGSWRRASRPSRRASGKRRSRWARSSRGGSPPRRPSSGRSSIAWSRSGRRSPSGRVEPPRRRSHDGIPSRPRGDPRGRERDALAAALRHELPLDHRAPRGSRDLRRAQVRRRGRGGRHRAGARCHVGGGPAPLHDGGPRADRGRRDRVGGREVARRRPPSRRGFRLGDPRALRRARAPDAGGQREAGRLHRGSDGAREPPRNGARFLGPGSGCGDRRPAGRAVGDEGDSRRERAAAPGRARGRARRCAAGSCASAAPANRRSRSS